MKIACWMMTYSKACGMLPGNWWPQGSGCSRASHAWEIEQIMASLHLRSMEEFRSIHGSLFRVQRFSSTKNSWRARLFKGKGYRFWDYRFLKKWCGIFLKLIPHVFAIPQLKIMASGQSNPPSALLLLSQSGWKLRAKGICGIFVWICMDRN